MIKINQKKDKCQWQEQPENLTLQWIYKTNCGVGCGIRIYRCKLNCSLQTQISFNRHFSRGKSIFLAAENYLQTVFEAFEDMVEETFGLKCLWENCFRNVGLRHS